MVVKIVPSAKVRLCRILRSTIGSEVYSSRMTKSSGPAQLMIAPFDYPEARLFENDSLVALSIRSCGRGTAVCILMAGGRS